MKKGDKAHKKVLVGGVFDILHYGHIHFLKNAKKLGGHLTVALESDENVRRLKGKKRPIHGQNERREMLETLNCVDKVIILPNKMTDKDYDALVLKTKPDVIAVTKGDPMLKNKQDQAAKVGAKVVIIPKINEASTTKIAKILGLE